MKQTLETNRIITGSLFIIATIAVSFILNFAQPFLVPLVLALLIRILIDPIIDYQIDFLHVHRIVAVFVSLCLIIFLFIIIVPFIGSSVVTFLQSADDYNNKVLILIDLGISKLKEFNINSILTLCSEEEIKTVENIEKMFKVKRIVLPDHKSGKFPNLIE